MYSMSEKAQEVATRFQKGFVTDEQLNRYRLLGVITEEEYNIIYNLKYKKEV